MMISPADHTRITAAIRAAETHTCGQIVCVLARGTSGYFQVSALWAAALALAVPWPLLALTAWSAQRIFVLQLLVFGVALVVTSWEPVRLRLVPRPVKRARAHREALQQFHARGLARTRSRCGVLVFVSLTDRYARVIADEGIAARVTKSDWQGVIAILTAHMRHEAIADGFVAAVERCGTILAQKAPLEGPRDELPDRLYLI